MQIHCLSPHQPLIGRNFQKDGVQITCLAAHEDAILVLRCDSNGQPINYVVCHHPQIKGDGTLVWHAGDYFTILNYQHCGRDNPMAEALSDAVHCLLAPQLLSFYFAPLEDEASAEVLVELSRPLSQDEIDALNDCISAYIDHVEAFTYEQCVNDVLKSFPQFSYRLLKPDVTFKI